MKRVTKKRNIIKLILLEQKEILDNQKAIIKDFKQLSAKQKEQENLNYVIKCISIVFLFTRILIFITNYF